MAHIRVSKLIVAALALAALCLFVVRDRGDTDLQGSKNARAIGSDEAYTGESLFAHIDPVTGEVTTTIVASKEVINSGTFGNPTEWVRVHADASKRKRPMTGDVYDKANDVFKANEKI